jgi:hypothetical protein
MTIFDDNDNSITINNDENIALISIFYRDDDK